MTKLYLAIPCYNEEEVLRDSAEKLLNKYSTMMAEGKISADSRIVFIDDGSKDRTWEIISELHTENPIFQGIKLSRNRGHQNALLCGLMTLKDKADAVISIDADLQDDINTFDEMVAKYEDGCDVVYGVRSKRETDTFFKRFTAEGFYKILNHMGAKVIFNHADFRLMSKRALNAFSLYKETNIFLRGMFPMRRKTFFLWLCSLHWIMFGINAKKIGIIGHSAGGIIAFIVAKKDLSIAFVVSLAGAGVRGDSLMLKQVELISKSQGMPDAVWQGMKPSIRNRYAILQQTDKTPEELQKELYADVTKTMSPEQLKDLNTIQQISAQISSMTSPWYLHFMRYDPAKAMKKINS